MNAIDCYQRAQQGFRSLIAMGVRIDTYKLYMHPSTLAEVRRSAAMSTANIFSVVDSMTAVDIVLDTGMEHDAIELRSVVVV